MRKHQRMLKSLIARLREIRDSGGVESGQREAYTEALKSLDHAAQVGDHLGVLEAVNTIARCLLRGLDLDE